MNVIEATDVIVEGLAPYGDGCSVRWDSKRADLQPEVEDGRVVGLRLVPGRVTLAVAFDKFGTSYVRVSLCVGESTVERCVETVLDTVKTLLESLERQ